MASTVACRDSYDSRARGNLNNRAPTDQSFDRGNKSRAFTSIKNQLDAILLADRGDDGGGDDVFARWTVYSYNRWPALSIVSSSQRRHAKYVVFVKIL